MSELGEMTRTFVALCLQETRAFIEGLAQEKSPSQAGLLQVNRVAQPGRHRVAAQPVDRAVPDRMAEAVFGSAIETPTTDPHAGTPTIGTPNGANNVASVAF